MSAPDEVWNIAGRRRFDPMSVSLVADFKLRPADAVDQSLSWTPYCWDARSGQMALVGCPAQVDHTAAPFYYQSQYRHARQLRLAEVAALRTQASARKFRTPVMIYSTGRAGTTLLSKMLARLPQCVSLSEPDLYTSVLERHPDPESDDAISLLQAGGDLCFQPTNEQATHLVLKFRGMGIELAGALRRAHPAAKEVFLYRDAEAYITSSMRAFSYWLSPLWAIRWLHGLYVTRPILEKVLNENLPTMQRFFPAVKAYTPRELVTLGPVGMLTLSWVSMMDRAHALGLPSLRYETLKARPREVFEALCERFELTNAPMQAALAALDEDSQQGSVVARRRTKRFELSTQDRRLIEQVLARHSGIQSPDFELSHAIA